MSSTDTASDQRSARQPWIAPKAVLLGSANGALNNKMGVGLDGFIMNMRASA